jgi:DNA-binding response OmpR family regulator
MTKILIVEDDEALRNGLSVDLTAEGYDVVTHGRGDSAVRTVLGKRPDLILLDVMLPDCLVLMCVASSGRRGSTLRLLF